ncbi:MAG: response regulator [Acetobacteraceae bacterium]|nr:response regulator [Acetobacteraceae bacterium]
MSGLSHYDNKIKRIKFMNGSRSSEPQPGGEWIVGGGEMGRLIRAMDWSPTPLGPIASWPKSLRITVNLCLASDLPICIIWGPELVQLYNDSYRVICGEKHPRSMGQNFPECWREAWPVIGAAHDSALAGDTAFLENQHIFLERHDYIEECFFTFSFSPIRDETGRLAGLFHPVIEMTPTQLSERRTRTLRDLASGVSNAKSVEEAFTLSTEALAEHPLDLPFVLIYRLDGLEQQARLVAATGLAPGTKGAPEIVPLHVPDHAAWPLGDVFRAGEAVSVDDVAGRFGNFQAGPFPEPIASAVLLPITAPGADRPMAVAIAGFSPRLRSNEPHRVFHDLLCNAITNAVVNAGAYDAEHRRGEALAKIDHMKTAFFANVSHEFRTPLTLMLSPLEDALHDERAPLVGAQRERLTMAHRNSLRLLKLVNTLLDFSAIEADRAHVNPVATDLAELTADLAAGFRSACERVGIRLVVDCPPLPELAMVDRDMWEKIVLNLLSNAFKFTFEGEIRVTLRSVGNEVELRIADTGVGIPNAELPRLFERFHRIMGQRSRTHEGSGIGLALVQELVRLQGGVIEVTSQERRGTEFTVTAPLNRAGSLKRQSVVTAAPPERALPTQIASYVGEALGWFATDQPGDPLLEVVRPSEASNSRILLADDNSDIRDYIARLLSVDCVVEAVANGEAALRAAHAQRPDLILADVMMPGLDGLGLLRAPRDAPGLKDIPVILLSARAGEESRIEGLNAGADDYVTKPFSSLELCARVRAHLSLARMRRDMAQPLADSEERLRRLFEEAPASMCVLRGPTYIFDLANAAYTRLTGRDDLLGKPVREVFPEGEGQPFFDLLDRVYQSGKPFSAQGMKFVMQAKVDGLSEFFLDFIYQPIFGNDGSVTGIFVEGSDVTAHVRAEAEVKSQQVQLQATISELQATASALRASQEDLRELNQKLEMRVAKEVEAKEAAQGRLAQAQRMEALGQLAGGIAHDFNNVLQVVSGGLHLIQKRAADPHGVAKIARMAHEASERGAAITGRLLAFSRKGELLTGRVEAEPLLENLREILTPTLGATIALYVAIAPDPPALLADKAQLETVLINLAVNSRDAMPDGGVLTIAWNPVTVAVGDDRFAGLNGGDYIQVDLSDTGEGMDDVTLRRASEPFFTTKPVGQGTGLGLAMARGFAEQSGGGFAIASELGQGTCVTLWFPQATEDREVSVEQDAALVVPGAPVRVLLVDDDPSVREIVAQQFEDLGYVVSQASNGFEALNKIETGERPDLLVTDYSMPGMNGLMVIEEVRRLQPHLPALLLTGFADAAIRLKLDDIQDTSILLLRKPVTADELIHQATALLASASCESPHME